MTHTIELTDGYKLELTFVERTHVGERWRYALKMPGQVEGCNPTLFTGNDYRPSPMCKTVEQKAERILCLLTLKPGDTDDEFFADYTPAQLAWAEANAERYSCEWSEMLLGADTDM